MEARRRQRGRGAPPGKRAEDGGGRSEVVHVEAAEPHCGEWTESGGRRASGGAPKASRGRAHGECRRGWRAAFTRQTKQARGLVSEWDNEDWVLESLLDPIFITTILLFLASQPILERLLEMLLKISHVNLISPRIFPPFIIPTKLSFDYFTVYIDSLKSITHHK